MLSAWGLASKLGLQQPRHACPNAFNFPTRLPPCDCNIFTHTLNQVSQLNFRDVNLSISAGNKSNFKISALRTVFGASRAHHHPTFCSLLLLYKLCSSTDSNNAAILPIS